MHFGSNRISLQHSTQCKILKDNGMHMDTDLHNIVMTQEEPIYISMAFFIIKLAS